MRNAVYGSDSAISASRAIGMIFGGATGSSIVNVGAAFSESKSNIAQQETQEKHDEKPSQPPQEQKPEETKPVEVAPAESETKAENNAAETKPDESAPVTTATTEEPAKEETKLRCSHIQRNIMLLSPQNAISI